MIFVALSEAADAGELLLADGGMCRFHLRRDGVVVIREILVLPTVRRLGIGRHLIRMVRQRHPTERLRAVCPAKYDANMFWEGMGFFIAAYKDGNLIVWESQLSSTVQTVTPPSPLPLSS